MKNISKIIIALLVGFATAWICMTGLNMDQVLATVITIGMTLAVYGCLSKIKSKTSE